MEHYLLIDCDTGSDDALAIWMALAAHRDPSSPIQIIGIVCSHGNTQVENVASNVLRTLQAADEHKVGCWSKLSCKKVCALFNQSIFFTSHRYQCLWALDSHWFIHSLIKLTFFTGPMVSGTTPPFHHWITVHVQILARNMACWQSAD